MVLLVERFNKLYSKMENHHHHHHHQQQQLESEALLASLQAFRSNVSNCINQLSLNPKPGPGILSLSWVQQLFELLPFINRAFAKLAVDIDHHMIKWKVKSTEVYLDYSLSLLDLLNSVSSSVSNLGRARLSLSHALSLVESSPSSGIERVKGVKFMTLSKEFKNQESKETEKERPCSCTERIIYQAMMEVKSIEFWVCSVVLAALSGDATQYLEMRKSAARLLSNSNPSLINLDNKIHKIIMEKGVMLKEVQELNEAAAGLAASPANGRCTDAVKEMQRNLKVFEELLDSFGKKVNRLFSEVLTARNELLDGIRYRKQ